MLLLFKTNDLLRGLETVLGTRYSSSSFIHMSKCCVKLIYYYEREIYYNKYLDNDTSIRVNESFASKLIRFLDISKFNLFSEGKEAFGLFKIYMLQLFLYVFNI